MKNLKKYIFPLSTVFVFILFYFFRLRELKYYPCILSFCLFCLFFVSLFSKKSAIERIASFYQEKFEEVEIVYIRNLTCVWVIFLFFNFCAALSTVFMPDFYWFLYNGCISYFIMGSIFAVEYFVRKSFKRRHGL